MYYPCSVSAPNAKSSKASPYAEKLVHRNVLKREGGFDLYEDIYDDVVSGFPQTAATGRNEGRRQGNPSPERFRMPKKLTLAFYTVFRQEHLRGSRIVHVK